MHTDVAAGRARSTTELSYRLVTSEGKPFEGPGAGQTRHPFALSRVYYDATVRQDHV